MAQPRWDSEEEEEGKGGKREKILCCISNPCFASFWLWNEGSFKLLSSTASTELSSSGRFVLLKVPQLFHDDSSINYEYLLLWSKAVTFFFLFPLPFKFGFKCAHITLTHTSSVPPVNADWRVGGRWKKEVEEGCWLCPVWSTEHCTRSLWEASDLSPSKRTSGHWRLLWNVAGFECMCACWCNETQKSISLSEWLTFLSSIMQALIFSWLSFLIPSSLPYE